MNYRYLEDLFNKKGINIYTKNNGIRVNTTDFIDFKNNFYKNIKKYDKNIKISKIHHGGKIYNYDMETNYEVQINIQKFENNETQVHLVMFDEEIDCGMIQIDKNNNNASIMTLDKNSRCVKCKNPNINYKVGDILIQIMLSLAFNKYNVESVSLTDISTYNCYGTTVNLQMLRTITHGKPYYMKFGFKPKYEIGKKYYKQNLKIFNENKNLEKETLKLIFICLIFGDTYKLYSSLLFNFFNNFLENNKNTSFTNLAKNTINELNKHINKSAITKEKIYEYNLKQIKKIYSVDELKKMLNDDINEIYENSTLCDNYVLNLIKDNLPINEFVKKLIEITHILPEKNKKQLCILFDNVILNIYNNLGYINNNNNKDGNAEADVYEITKEEYNILINNKLLNKNILNKQR